MVQQPQLAAVLEDVVALMERLRLGAIKQVRVVAHLPQTATQAQRGGEQKAWCMVVAVAEPTFRSCMMIFIKPLACSPVSAATLPLSTARYLPPRVVNYVSSGVQPHDSSVWSHHFRCIGDSSH